MFVFNIDCGLGLTDVLFTNDVNGYEFFSRINLKMVDAKAVNKLAKAALPPLDPVMVGWLTGAVP